MQHKAAITQQPYASCFPHVSLVTKLKTGCEVGKVTSADLAG